MHAHRRTTFLSLGAHHANKADDEPCAQRIAVKNRIVHPAFNDDTNIHDIGT